jgi:hypothetical protein
MKVNRNDMKMPTKFVELSSDEMECDGGITQPNPFQPEKVTIIGPIGPIMPLQVAKAVALAVTFVVETMKIVKYN